ncbi:MAG: glycosyltransferase [Candidatus Thermoplasmatota archaeon]
MEKTIYISVCGVGLGHAGRMLIVADELKKNGFNVVFSTFGDAYKFISKSYVSYNSPKIMWIENKDGGINVFGSIAISPILTLRFFEHLYLEKKRIGKLKPCAVISDTRYSPLIGAKHYRIPFFFVSNLLRIIFPNVGNKKFSDWFGRKISSANYETILRAREIFVPDFPKPYTISYDTLDVPQIIENRLNYVGPIIRKKPELLDRNELREKYGFSGISVYAAISGPGKSKNVASDLLIKTLRKFSGTALVVTGEPNKITERKEGNVKIMGWVENRYEVLEACDIVIARPGLTTIGEIIRFGKKCILIPTPNQPEQESNARSVKRLGIGEMIEQYELSEDKLNEKIQEVVNNKEIVENVKKMQEMAMKYDGAKMICEKIVQVV